MITLNLHFQCGFACEVASLGLSSAFGLVIAYEGTDVTLFFPTTEIRDAVRDALLKCPGCVARPDAEAIPAQGGGGDGGGGTAGATGTGGQPAVQAMDATEDWF